MFGEISLLMKLQANKDNPDKLEKIYYENTAKLTKLQSKYPNWRDKIEPGVLSELKRRGIPV